MFTILDIMFIFMLALPYFANLQVMQVVEAHSMFPYFLEKHLAIPTSLFFYLLVNGFSVIISIIAAKYWSNSNTHKKKLASQATPPPPPLTS